MSVTIPQGAFYIRLKGAQDVVVAKQPPGYEGSVFRATMPDGGVYGQPTVQTQTRSGSIDQLWTRGEGTKDANRFIHVATGLALRWNGRGQPLTLAPMMLNDKQQLWYPEDAGNSLLKLFAVEWNQAMNVLGNGPYGVYRGVGLWEYSGGQDNELWELFAETSLVSVESITYDTAKASVNLSLAPTVGVATAVDNRKGVSPLTVNVELQRSMTSSKQFSYSDSSATALKVAQTIGVKGGIDKVIEVSEQTVIESTATRTITLGDTTAQSITTSDKLTVGVTVAPGMRYQYAVMVSYGQVTVPYTATLARARPDKTIERTQVSGIYTGVNMVKFDIVATDITDGAAKPLQGTPPIVVREPAHA